MRTFAVYRGILRLAAVLSPVIGGGTAVRGDGPIIDGRFEEWSAATLIATDPAGDAANVFDITEVHADSRGAQLFVHFDTGALLNIQSGPEQESTLRLELNFPGALQLTVDFRNRLAFTGGNPDNFVPWCDLDYVSMSTYAADRFELRLDLAALGVGLDDGLTIDFSGSDSLSAPALFALETAAEQPTERSSQRAPCTTFRVASLNTLAGGLLDSERGPAIGRLVQSVAADIYCFQEQDSPVSSIAGRLEDLDPLANGGAWDVHTSGDTVIASQHALVPVPHDGDAAAIVDMGADGAVCVFSIHPRCCGYIGSGQDFSRIAEMEGVASTIEALRDGALGAGLEPYSYVPIIIIGDWNLVGSRTPLDVAEDPQGPNLTHWLLSHLSDPDVYTWRNDNGFPGSFSPGLLDLLAYSADLMTARNGFVLDSFQLDLDTLDELGLDAEDSQASDHLMLVGDFTTLAGGDFNGDGAVNAADLAEILAAWGACVLCREDMNFDGRVDAADLANLLAAWGQCH